MTRPPPKWIDIGGSKWDLWTRETLATSIPDGLVGAEIGVQKGLFARSLCDGGKPKLMYLVDCWEVNPGVKTDDTGHLHALRETVRAMSRELCNGTVRLVPEWSEKAAVWIPDESLDWVYIDCDHSLEGMRSDLKAWDSKVKAGGWIMGHDYNRESIRKALAEHTKQKIHLTEHNNSFIYVKEGK